MEMIKNSQNGCEADNPVFLCFYTLWRSSGALHRVEKVHTYDQGRGQELIATRLRANGVVCVMRHVQDVGV